MAKKAGLSKTKRAQIVILQTEEFCRRKISKKVSCSKTASHQAISRFQNVGLYHGKLSIHAVLSIHLFSFCERFLNFQNNGHKSNRTAERFDCTTSYNKKNFKWS